MTGIELIFQEQREQRFKHRYTQDYDAKRNSAGQLSQAAYYVWHQKPDFYKWPEGWSLIVMEKIMIKPPVARLAVAGAFMVSEVERLVSYVPKSQMRDQEVKQLRADMEQIGREIDFILHNPVAHAANVLAKAIANDGLLYEAWLYNIIAPVQQQLDLLPGLPRKKVSAAVKQGVKSFLNTFAGIKANTNEV